LNVDSILLSEFAVVTDDKLTVVNVFNHIRATKPPAGLPHMSVSLLIHGHSDEAGTTHEVRFKLINSRRDVITEGVIPFTFPAHTIASLPVRYTAIMNLLLPQFAELGTYAFEVYIDGTYHASSSFYVGS
jgi:hypothetical protein